MKTLRRVRARFDPLADDVLDDPYATYDDVRAAGRICRFGPVALGLTHHRDVAPLLRDGRLSNEFPDDPVFQAGDDDGGEMFDNIMPTSDVTNHALLRELMHGAFGPGQARRIETSVEARVLRTIEPILEVGTFDGVDELAAPVPIGVVCELMGLPEWLIPEIQARASLLSKAFTPFIPGGDADEATAAMHWFRSTIEAILRDRWTDLGDDLLSELLRAVDRGALTFGEVLDNVVFVFFTGYETTMSMMSTALKVAVDHPHVWGELQERRDLIKPALEEFLRFDAPIQYSGRLATEEIDLGDGAIIRAGRPVFLMLGCANRDPEVFDRPHEVVLDRASNPHVSFGGGVRGCLGIALARVEGAVMMRTLLDHIAEIGAAGPAVRDPSALFRTYAHLPMEITPR